MAPMTSTRGSAGYERIESAFLTTYRGEGAREARQYEARTAQRAQAYSDSTVSTVSKRNEVVAGLPLASAVRR